MSNLLELNMMGSDIFIKTFASGKKIVVLSGNLVEKMLLLFLDYGDTGFNFYVIGLEVTNFLFVLDVLGVQLFILLVRLLWNQTTVCAKYTV
jgi:hypothetical protein